MEDSSELITWIYYALKYLELDGYLQICNAILEALHLF